MNRFIILMFHMISEPKTAAEVKYACPPIRFEKNIQFLLNKGFKAISIEAVEKCYTQKIPLPDKSFLITFDDGFEDNYLNAFPILQSYNLPAMIYLATGFIGKSNLWMTTQAFSEHKMLSWSQIKEMTKFNIHFGSHTVTHPNLTELSDKFVRDELIQSKNTIEDQLGSNCKHFAYPYGLFTEKTCALVKQSGFKTACSTRSGFNNSERDPFILHRIEIYGNDTNWTINQKLMFGINDASLLFPIKYYSARLLSRFS